MLAFDGVVYDTDCGYVVDVNWCRWLWLSGFGKDKSKYFCFLCIQEECPQFGFCCGCSNQLEDGARDMNGPVKFDWVSIAR